MFASVMLFKILGDKFSNRVYPHPAPKSADKSTPYVTYQKISTVDALHDLERFIGAEQIRMQVNIFHPELLLAEHLAADVKRMLTTQQLCACTYIDCNSQFDEETQLNAEMIDFFIWQSAC